MQHYVCSWNTGRQTLAGRQVTQVESARDLTLATSNMPDLRMIAPPVSRAPTGELDGRRVLRDRFRLRSAASTPSDRSYGLCDRH